MYIALYKNKKRLDDWFVAKWTRGIYSHVEVVFDDGMSASASGRDGCVRFKKIKYNPENWDFIDVNGFMDEETVRQWFIDNEGKKYDWIGLIGFVVAPIPDQRNKYICSEALATAFRFIDGYRFSPNHIPALFRRPIIDGFDFISTIEELQII
jgi:hypothetical protein